MKSDSRTVDYPVTAFRLTRRNALKVISLGILTLHLAKSPGQTARTKPVRIVTLGDSITKGVRPGVNAAETFAAVLESRAKMAGYQAEVVNVGIGGERTDQALARFDQDVIAKHPDILTVMYGAIDSYVDPGKTGPRISPASFRENLAKIVERAQAANIRVVLMTEPRWGAKPPPNGLGEHPNLRLAEFMKIVREVAVEKKVPLVDHIDVWTSREAGGLDLATVTTDLLHPNPAGHRLLAETIWPVIEPIIQKAQASK